MISATAAGTICSQDGSPPLDSGQDIGRLNRQVRLVVSANRFDTTDLEQ